MSGIGRIFKRKWRKLDGTMVESRFFSIGFPFHGRERVEGTKCETAAAAKQALRRRMEEIGRGEYLPGRSPTVREAATSWLESRGVAESRRGGAIKESTVEFWKNHIDHYIVPILGDYKCDRVDARMVEKARDMWKAENKLAGRTVNSIMSTLQAIFKKQIALGSLRFNPVIAAERLATKSAAVDTEEIFAVNEGEVYSPDELRDLLAGAKPGSFDEAYLTTVALTMLRRGEALALKWSDIDFESREIMIRRSWAGRFRDGKPVFWTPKTKHSIRKVPIADHLVGLLKRWKLANAPGTHDLVFARANGLPYPQSAAWHALANSCGASGVRKLTIHALRHTGCSILLMSGISPIEVSTLMGHSSVHVTLAIYAHFIPKMRTDSASRLAEAVFGGSKEEKAGKGC